MADAKMLNKAKVLARLARVPVAIQEEMDDQLEIEVNGLVEAQKRAAPRSTDLADDPGTFADSIHSYANPDRPLSYRIIADAQDAKGAFIGPHIEHGHMAKDGTHVPAKPSFFPIYRSRKRPMRRRLNARARKAAKALFPE